MRWSVQNKSELLIAAAELPSLTTDDYAVYLSHLSRWLQRLPLSTQVESLRGVDNEAPSRVLDNVVESH